MRRRNAGDHRDLGSGPLTLPIALWLSRPDWRAVPLTLVCSLGLAMLLNQKVKFRNFFRTVSFFPYVASLVAVLRSGT